MKSSTGLLIGLGLVLLFLVNSVAFTVSEWEQVVVTQFGEPVDIIQEPGLNPSRSKNRRASKQNVKTPTDLHNMIANCRDISIRQKIDFPSQLVGEAGAANPAFLTSNTDFCTVKISERVRHRAIKHSRQQV